MSAEPPVGILVMAYGTASGPDDIERYYTDIRGGRRPEPEHLAELKARYGAIGNRFPLLDITRTQAERLEQALNGKPGRRFRTFLGMKHSPPFIADGVAEMRDAGIERAVGLVMAPHWSSMSVETYVDRVERAVAERGGPEFTFVRRWYDHPAFLSFLAGQVAEGVDALGSDIPVIFSAHSLPQRTLEDGSTRCLTCERCPQGCEYRRQLQDTADLVSGRLGLQFHTIAWQSAGRTAHPWLGPSVDDTIRSYAAEGRPGVILCSAGFVADHLEILHDLDIEARQVAERAGMRFVRTEMPNVQDSFVSALAAVVLDHLASTVPA